MSPDAMTVMAYVDGELAAAERAAFEAALAGDPALRESVAREEALRAALGDAFAPVLAEPVPARLRAALGTAVVAPVIDLQAVREQRARRRWHWPEWGAMAACLVIGVAIGVGPWAQREGAWLARGADGGLVAQGPLARALTQDLASAPTAGPVVVGLSFVARDQRYCRSFTMAGASPSAGLACRAGAGWSVVALAPAAAPASGNAFRTAASALPPALLAQIDAMGAAPALDAAAERSARDAGWQRAR